MRGNPCTCCSRSQQRSSPGLRLRLAALLVLIERVWWISHPLSTSSALDIWQKHISRICGRRSCRPARYLSSSTQPYFRAVSCNSSSTVFLNHYRTLRTKQRRGSKAYGFRKQCHEGSTTSSREMTRWYTWSGGHVFATSASPRSRTKNWPCHPLPLFMAVRMIPNVWHSSR